VDEATTMHLEAADFVKLERNEDHGRIVVATKEIDVGCKIIREKPVLVWQSEKWKSISQSSQHCHQLSSQEYLICIAFH